MKVLLLLALILGVHGELSPPERSYKILMLLPVSSRSHRNVFMPLAEAMANRGHEITILANNAPVSKNPNIKEFMHGLTEFNTDTLDMFKLRDGPSEFFNFFVNSLQPMAKKFYHIPIVKDLFARRKEFDLIVYDHAFNNMIYPFAYELPSMSIATPGLDFQQSAIFGNVLNPACYPTTLQDFAQPYSFVHRALNLFLHLVVSFMWRNWAVVPVVQTEISKVFPEMPLLLDLERNQSLTLINSHFSMDTSVPLLPSQVEVGGMHCHPGQPLPQDLLSFIEEASEGVVYFSLGSVVHPSSIPKKYLNIILEAIGKLPQKVLWKFEGNIINVPKNVLIRKWLPQQDILAHPNVKVFMSHVGLLSTQEAIYHATPVLAMPIYGDQPRNAERLQLKKLGITVNWEDLTSEQIVNSVKELIENPEYRTNIREASEAFRDQPQPPLERAVFWTEYVVRHRGAPQLRSPAVQLSWVQFLMLDVLALLLVAVLLCLYLIRACLRAILRKIGGGQSKKKKE